MIKITSEKRNKIRNVIRQNYFVSRKTALRLYSRPSMKNLVLAVGCLLATDMQFIDAKKMVTKKAPAGLFPWKSSIKGLLFFQQQKFTVKCIVV